MLGAVCGKREDLSAIIPHEPEELTAAIADTAGSLFVCPVEPKKRRIRRVHQSSTFPEPAVVADRAGEMLSADRSHVGFFGSLECDAQENLALFIIFQFAKRRLNRTSVLKSYFDGYAVSHCLQTTMIRSPQWVLSRSAVASRSHVEMHVG